MSECPVKPELAQQPSTTTVSDSLEVRDLVQEAELESASKKIWWRIVPLCVAVAFMNHLDRSNLAYASLSFNRDNGFDVQVYSLGASLFFVSFCICQVPANLIMVRVGFRPWLAFLLCAWGAVAVCFMFINTPWKFYLMRILLGVFESGAFPAMWYALSVFVPRKSITKPYAFLTMGIMMANMVGGPLALLLLLMNNIAGLKGWQWLFLLEGVPSIILGGIVFMLLPGSISSATFLTPAEKQALEAEVARDHVPGPLAKDLKGAAALTMMALKNTYLWPLFVFGIMMSIAATTYVIYTPIIINNLLQGTALGSNVSVAAGQGQNPLLPVALAVIPYFLAVVFSYIVAHSSQKCNEIFLHISACLLAGGVLMMLFAPLAKAAVPAGFLALSLSLAACFASNGPGMALIARLCRGREQVVAQPLSNSFTLLGGIIGPLVTGALLKTSGGFTYVSIIMGTLMLVTGLSIIAVRAWVMYDGGLPEGGVARRTSDLAGKGSDGHLAPSHDAKTSAANGDVCLVLDKGLSQPDAPTAHTVGTTNVKPRHL